MIVATVILSRYGLTALQGKVNDLNKRAARFKLEPLTVAVTKEIPFVPVRYSKGKRYIGLPTTLYDVRVEGVEPVIKGWKLLARVEFDNIVGAIVRTVPGVESVPVKYEQPICEHCNSNRRRNDIFVLQGPEGVKAVGRNCLADFIRNGDAETLACWAEFAERIRELDSEGCEDGYWSMGLPPTVIDLPVFLAATSLMMRKFGWLSRTKAKDQLGPVIATADLAFDYVYGRDTPTKQAWIDKHDLYPEAKDSTLAAAAIEWAKTVEGNDYLDNIRKIAQAGSCNAQHAGYAASIIIAWQKATERLQERKRDNATREFFGEAGKRYRKVPVTVTRIRYIEGQYGVRTIVTMEVKGATRQVLTWFASGEHEYEGEYLADFTVKGHEDNEYGKATIVQRANLKSLVASC